ncbi:MAG: cation:proton antiporter [Chloroflexota bacterium]|nr:cation:proton antiporter [Chloroflexota bacterium]
MSATDPVAVVAVFRELGVPRWLLTLVEGESLLNDGVAIVLFTILLAAALGEEVSVAAGITDFVQVFFGGAVIGAALGVAAAFTLPWLDRLSAAALSLAVAYGGFVLADDVLGFSGVMATVATGLVLGGLAPSRASSEVRVTWRELWEALGHVANALLFLLIGLAIDPALVADNLGAILLAVVVVLVARAAAVVPLVSALERFAGIPPVGRRNEAVLVWGGLRGGVALALALALPEELPQREEFVAMTGGVVLATLLLNATTISALVHRLRLDAPSRGDRFLAASARLSGIETARARLADLGLDDPAVDAELDAAERSARAELERIKLSTDEERGVVLRRGLFVERETYQRLSDAGLLPPPTTRALLHEVDGQIEQATLTGEVLPDLRRDRPRFEKLAQRLTAWLPEPLGADADELAYAEASARRIAARRTGEALTLFEHLPNVTAAAIKEAKAVFARWERHAVSSLDGLYPDADPGAGEQQRRQAAALGRVAAAEALDELAVVGLLPERVARQAAESVAAEVDRNADSMDE